jgi:S-adenosylmethionine:tRNA ribosyltransferase-isomerase
LDVRDFDFDLPPELIGQEPPRERGSSRLLYLSRDTGAIVHTSIGALPELLRAGDLLVVNNTRVFPARLLGRRVPTGGAVECLLVRPIQDSQDSRAPREPGTVWEALVHPGQKLRPGARLVFEASRHTIHGEILERRFFGRRLVRLWTEDGTSLDQAVDAIGHVPLPPYIHRDDRFEDRDRYQTIFAQVRGSIAAPTAGLHFSPALVEALARQGVERADITLHVGYGTFQPVRTDIVEAHRMDVERFDISEAAARTINRALDDGRRVIAVGTTTTRALEAASAGGRVTPGAGETDLFIYPGHTFKAVGAMVTNFHLPKSSLLMLVSALAGRERVLAAYRAAIAERYRFYSYGDGMLIL